MFQNKKKVKFFGISDFARVSAPSSKSLKNAASENRSVLKGNQANATREGRHLIKVSTVIAVG